MKVILSSYITYEDVFSLMPPFQRAEILLKASMEHGEALLKWKACRARKAQSANQLSPTMTACNFSVKRSN